MQIGEFYVIKGFGGYYTPSLYKGHYQRIDIDEYKKKDRKWSKESCEILLDSTSLYPKQEMGYNLVKFVITCEEVV